MEIRAKLELEVENEEYEAVLGNIIKAMAQEVRSLGKTDFTEYSEDDVRRLAAAAFQVTVSSVFDNDNVTYKPPF